MLDNLTGIASVQVALDDAPLQPLTLDATGRFSFIPTMIVDGSTDGVHRIRFQATDHAVWLLPASFNSRSIRKLPQLTYKVLQ